MVISSLLLQLIISIVLIHLSASSSPSSICPESPVSVFARCELTVSFRQSCQHVRSEIISRIHHSNNNKKWIDPHNHGTYTLDSSRSSNSSYLEASHVTGNGLYTDKLALKFVSRSIVPDTKNEEIGCALRACSTSQVTSVVDYSTNYCNLHNLYCNRNTGGCSVLKYELTTAHGEAYPDCWQRKLRRCNETKSIKKKDL